MGAELDSIADDLTIAVTIIGMSVFKHEFLRQEIAVASMGSKREGLYWVIRKRQSE